MDMYKKIHDSCLGGQPKTKTFAQLIQIVRDHVCPKKNEAMERCKFQQANQAPTEYIANHVARLKDLAAHCNFKDVNDAIRDQLECGIAGHGTRVALFSEEKLTYKKALQIATTTESALRNAVRTDKPYQSTVDPSINHFGPSRRRDSGKSFERKSDKGSTNTDSKANNFSSDRKYICFCCGMVNNHHLEKCRMKDISCNSFQGEGLMEKMCFKKHGKDSVISKCLSNFDSRKIDRGNVNFLRDDKTEESTTSEDYGLDFCPIFSRPLLENEESSLKIIADPMYVTVNILSKEIEMEIDSGAYVAAMSEFNQ
ncbi:hypothetical protein QAD02_007701 [Eretmocerus hayati]|uniref:Uncharacterized protein n=1 Tax=Eretmocerus hayati TaxID=131215 RepID=A0ACC2N4A9_9HYME|nr:hypothetical protein QAD02_007701 [Eretmocerus hayati]